MKYALLFLLSLMTPQISAAQAEGAAGTHANDEAKLVALTKEWIQAINEKDRPKLERLMSPDFVLHGWDESWYVARPEWLKNLFDVIAIAEYRHSAIVSRIYGRTGTVTSNWYWKGVRNQKPFEEHGYAVDIWQHKPAGWQVVSRITVILPGPE